MAAVLLAAACLPLTSCFKLQRESRQDPLPPALIGVWTGDWSSDNGTGIGGPVRLDVLSFRDQPILQVDTLHPCLTGSGYQFVQSGPVWELRLDAVTVFEATLDLDARRLDGVYQCLADQGVWGVEWDRELPAVGDLTGSWLGSWNSIQPLAGGEFTMDLEQTYEQGQLGLRGVICIDSLGVKVPLDRGGLIWRESGFDIFLEGGQAPGPVVLLQGRGDPTTLAVEDGLLILEHPQAPFRLALWSARPE